MAVLVNTGFGAVTNMCTALGGNVEATNRVQRRADRMGYGSLLRITTAIGATPTCTFLVEGSPDGASWFALPLQDLPTAGGPPGTLTSATFVITTAATFWKLLPVDIPWIFLRITTVVGTTCTYLVEGSPDNVSWLALPLQDLPTAGGPPGTLTSAAFVITTAATFWKLLPVDLPWIFLRVTMSANTGVTSTIDLFAF